MLTTIRLSLYEYLVMVFQIQRILITVPFFRPFEHITLANFYQILLDIILLKYIDQLVLILILSFFIHLMDWSFFFTELEGNVLIEILDYSLLLSTTIYTNPIIIIKIMVIIRKAILDKPNLS